MITLSIIELTLSVRPQVCNLYFDNLTKSGEGKRVEKVERERERFDQAENR